ncbi:MAG: cytochrome C [Anaerolineae bacterium]|nr:cytochrome C [Anaerolineae bacterium]RIK21246.1 MAG: cytochrome C [Anaerolineae bacterium]
MSNFFKKIIGPRTPQTLDEHERRQFHLPNVLLGIAAVLLLASMFLPYWKMTLKAPQYPGGLSVEVYVNRLTGDVSEIDGLNHYIGMRPLGEAAQLERAVSMVAVGALVLLVLAAIFVHSPWALLLALPAILWPFIFIADMYFWMRHFGLNLDPTAPLSSSIEPFVPPILGTGMVGQFETIASFQIGLWMAFLAVALILAGLYYQRKAYKPLVDKS